MADKLNIAKSKDKSLAILPVLANRHGLIAGAIRAHKTATLQKMAENFSKAGIPVFLPDIKGDLTGIGVEGNLSPTLKAKLTAIGVKNWQPTSSPVVLWDIFGEKGHPVRATLTDMGPLLLSQLLDLNEEQSGILRLVFKIADDNSLLLLDMKDLKTLLQFVDDNTKQLTMDYGNISSASIAAIQKSLLTLEQQGADFFFGEPILDINDLMRFNIHGQGVVNILSAEKLFNYPNLYSVFLLWLLSELFEQLPEVGDMDKPKLVFFFDEADLLFSGISPILLQKIEQMVRLIRFRGVGVYFVAHYPDDIPDCISNLLSNRVQHALTADTPRDREAIKAAARMMQPNPKVNIEKVITELDSGEALVSFLDEKGDSNPVERSTIIVPGSRVQPMTPDEMNTAINHSTIYGKYEAAIDRMSAYKILKAGYVLHTGSVARPKQDNDKQKNIQNSNGFLHSLITYAFGLQNQRSAKKESAVQTATKTVSRQLANQLSRHIYRGILGGISGGRKK